MSIFQVLTFLVSVRLRGFRSNPASIIISLLVLAGAAANGLGIALSFVIAPELRNGAPIVFNLAILIAAVLVALADVIPSYRPVSPPVPAYYPIPRWQRGTLAALWDLLSLPVASGVLFLTTLLLSPGFGPLRLAAALLFLALIWTGGRTLRVTLEHALPGRLLHALTALAVTFAGGVALFRGNWPGGALLALVTASFAAGAQHLWLLYLMAGEAVPAVPSEGRASPRVWALGFVSAVWAVCWRSRRFRVSVTTGLLLKATMLGMFTLILARKHEWPFGSLAPIYFIASPIVVFSYAMNNAFGHASSLWETVELHVGTPWQARYLYMLMLVGPLLADLAITIVFGRTLGFLDVRFAIYYTDAALALTAIGMWSSLVDARPVSASELLRLRNNTSALFNLGASVPTVALLATSLGAGHLPLATLVVIGIVAATGIASHRHYATLGTRTYARLTT